MTLIYAFCLSLLSGTRMFFGRIEESSKKIAQSVSGQKVKFENTALLIDSYLWQTFHFL